MCNRYRPASPERIRLALGDRLLRVTSDRGWAPGIGPLQPGPFIRAGVEGGLDLQVGQWGLTPDESASLKPVSKRTGRPMSTNNARWGKGEPEAWTFKGAWRRGQRCLVPAEDYDEPYWGTGRNIWWRFARADGQPWMLAGLWNEWADPGTGEVVPSYTMLTVNCDIHPLLRLMHRPEKAPDGTVLPDDQQDKRSVVPLEPAAWDAWLNGTKDEAAAAIRLPGLECFRHGAVDPKLHLDLPVTTP